MYNLVIYDDRKNEQLTIDGQDFAVPLFYAASAVLKILRRGKVPLTAPVDQGLRQLAASHCGATEQLLKSWQFLNIGGTEATLSVDFEKDDHPYSMPSPLKVNSHYDLANSDAEWICLYSAVDSWLIPKTRDSISSSYLKPKDRFLESTVQIPDDPDIYASLRAVKDELGNLSQSDCHLDLWLQTYLEGMFRYRTSAVSTEIFVTQGLKSEKRLGHLYKSKSFLSLAWMEIMWAIENDVYAHFCQQCGSIFHLARPYSRQAYLCSGPCYKQYRTARMGGQENLRQYNREAQRRRRSR